MNKRWEFLIPLSEIEEFKEFYFSLGNDELTVGTRDGFAWVICYPTLETILVGKLKFSVTEVVDKFGIAVTFTDCPT